MVVGAMEEAVVDYRVPVGVLGVVLPNEIVDGLPGRRIVMNWSVF